MSSNASTTTNNIIEFKLTRTGEPTRRISFPNHPAWADLASRISELYGIPADTLAVAYIDKEDDEITVSSDPELQLWLAELGDAKSAKIDVRTLGASADEDEDGDDDEEAFAMLFGMPGMMPPFGRRSHHHHGRGMFGGRGRFGGRGGPARHGGFGRHGRGGPRGPGGPFGHFGPFSFPGGPHFHHHHHGAHPGPHAHGMPPMPSMPGMPGIPHMPPVPPAHPFGDFFGGHWGRRGGPHHHFHVHERDGEEPGRRAHCKHHRRHGRHEHRRSKSPKGKGSHSRHSRARSETASSSGASTPLLVD